MNCLRNKMICAVNLDYSEEEVRSVNLTRSSSPNCAQRQDRLRRLELGLEAVDDRNIFSALPRSVCSTTCCCIAFRTVESDDFFRSTETVFAYLDKAYPDTQVLFWNNLFLDELLAKAEKLHLPFLRFCLETCKPIGEL